MKIAIMCSAPGVGLCPYPVELALRFHALGHEVHAICGSDKEYEPGLRAKLDQARLPVHVVPFTEAVGIRGFSPFDFSLRRTLDRLAPDVVQSWGPRFAFQGRPFSRRRRPRPLHVAMIMSMAHDANDPRRERLAAAFANRYLDRVLALCELESKRLASVGVRPDKTQVMLAPMACAPNLRLAADARAKGRDAVLARFGLRPDRNYLGCFAQFRPVKRQDLLIQAFTALAAEFPDWDLVLAGAGPGMEACRNLAAALPGRVRFLGSIPHDAAIALMTFTDAVAHCSTVETFGYSMLEPLLLGVPTVMSRVGIAAEIEREELAVVVDPGSLPALVEGLRTVLRRDPRVRAMAERAPRWVTQTFDTPLVAANLLDLYQRMLADRAR